MEKILTFKKNNFVIEIEPFNQSDIGMAIDEVDINDIIQRSKGSQREIMTEVVKKIADKLLAEEYI